MREPEASFGRPCGDGVRAGDKDCDDDPDNSDARSGACRSDCRAATCGDAVVHQGEQRDDGDAHSDTQPEACRTDCTTARYGNGVSNDAEACDDAAANDDLTPGACRTACERAGCGDDVLDDGEDCDDGARNSDALPDACRLGCRAPSCGDNVINAGEDCDDGSANSDTDADSCRATCGRARCGDGVVDAGEGCDEGALNADEPGACRTTCAPAARGAGVVDAGEACDGDNDNSSVGCDPCARSEWRVSVVLEGAVEPRTRLAVAVGEPTGVAVDARGRVLVAEAGRHRVVRIDLDDTVTVVAGRASTGSSGDGQPAALAQRNGPRAVAVDDAGRLWVANTDNHRIRQAELDGTIRTGAGNGAAGPTGAQGPALGAQLNGPRAVAVDRLGRLFIANTGHNRVRRVDFDGTITRSAGQDVAPGNAGPTRSCSRSLLLGDPLTGDIVARSTQFLSPAAVVVASDGAVLIAATGNGCVRRLTADGLLATVASDLARRTGGGGDAARRRARRVARRGARPAREHRARLQRPAAGRRGRRRRQRRRRGDRLDRGPAGHRRRGPHRRHRRRRRLHRGPRGGPLRRPPRRRRGRGGDAARRALRRPGRRPAARRSELPRPATGARSAVRQRHEEPPRRAARRRRRGLPRDRRRIAVDGGGRCAGPCVLGERPAATGRRLVRQPVHRGDARRAAGGQRRWRRRRWR
ncbi:MAG: hypothetical protein FJ137_04325 [Deltaproteobacteria bacterium]|nr:hypothetical protein [Deltaproteobacteria bacterium]